MQKDLSEEAGKEIKKPYAEFLRRFGLVDMDRIPGKKCRKKKRIRAVALFFAAALLFCAVFSLTGCGQGAGKRPSSKNTDQALIESVFLDAEDGELTLAVGESYLGEIIVTGTGENVLQRVRLRSTDPAVASVWLNNDTHERSTDYRITALSEGIAFVYASSDDGTYSGRIRITVTDPSCETTDETAADTTNETASETMQAASAGIEEDETVPQEYVLNTNTGKFHYPWCASVKQMKDKNKKEVSDTRENIIAAGYVPCKNCKP